MLSGQRPDSTRSDAWRADSNYIGGYQVVKKWLSYREKGILGRPLKLEEIEYVTEMVQRIAAIILLQPELDENYERIKSNTYNWPG